MKNRKIIIPTFITVVLLILSICLINYRTPFFTAKRGVWSLGYVLVDSISHNIPIQKGKILSKEKMIQIDANTSFLADPFSIVKGDTIYIFFEHKRNKRGADISVLKSVDAINFNYDRIVLDESFHLSYPYVFEHKDDYYMLPETKEAKNVLLYKAHNFPYDWRIHDTLISDVILKDPSIFLSDTLNFLVAADNDLKLFIYESDSLTGKWGKKKEKNILNYGTETRPGGRIFIDNNNKITIPIQNRTKGYGYGLSLYVLEFNKDGDYIFRVKNKLILKAEKNIYEFSGGMHHIDIQKYKGQYFVVYDGISELRESQKTFNWVSPLKGTYYDIKNFLYNLN